MEWKIPTATGVIGAALGAGLALTIDSCQDSEVEARARESSLLLTNPASLAKEIDGRADCSIIKGKVPVKMVAYDVGDSLAFGFDGDGKGTIVGRVTYLDALNVEANRGLNACESNYLRDR